jgi:hypothetical protein
MTLYELTAQYQELLEIAKDPDLDPQVLMDTMEGLTGEIEAKAEGYAVVINELETEEAKFRKEAERLLKHADGLKVNAKHMRENLMNTMVVMNRKKFTTEHYKFSVVGNGGVKPLRITGKVPDTFMMLKPEPDTKRIREALEEGFELEWAHLEERGKHLSIK